MGPLTETPMVGKSSTFVATREQEEHTVGKGQVLTIDYFFNKQRQFNRVLLRAEDFNSMMKQVAPLIEAATDKYGEPDRKSRTNFGLEESYFWEGDSVAIRLDVINMREKKTRVLRPYSAKLDISSKKFADAVDTTGL